MAIPSSDRFDIVDYNYRADSHGEGQTLTDGTIIGNAFIQYGNVVVDGDGLAFLADTGASAGVAKNVVSSMVIEDALEYVDSSGIAGSGIPQSFTFEFDITLTDSIPKDFTNKSNRLFVGALNQQGYSAGLLFSHQGIALADSPEDEFPRILGGSLDPLINKSLGGGFYEDGTNIRVIVNGELGRVTVYAIPAKDAYDEGSSETNAPVIYSAEAKETKTTFGDGILVSGSGDTEAMQLDKGETYESQDVLFSVRSLRVSTARLIPEDAPLAVATGPQFMTIGDNIDFSGKDSYDPEGGAITFNWEVEVSPAGSNARFQGSSNASCQLKSISSYDDSTVDVVKLVFETPSAKYNKHAVHVTANGPGLPLTIDYDRYSEQLMIKLATDAEGNITTTATDIVSAFSDKLSSGYNVQVSGGLDDETGVEYPRLIRASLILTGTAGDDIIETGSFLFSGGSGSTLVEPSFIPDVEGIYVVSLQVSNGRRSSRKSRVTTTASFTAQLLGHRPHTKYVFKYISDFWKMVKDTDQIESIWSSLTQVLSNELMQTWQNDYAKSLRDVSRKYQRRWVSHDPVIEIDFDGAGTTLVVDSYSEKALNVPHVENGNSSKQADSVEMWGSSPISAGLKLMKSSLGLPYVVDVVSVDPLLQVSGTVEVEDTLTHHCEGIPGLVHATETSTELTYEETGYYRVITAGEEILKYNVISERSSGYFVKDPADPDATTPIFSSVLTDKTYPLWKVDEDKDVMRLYTDSKTMFGDIIERDVEGVANTIRLADFDGVLFNEYVDGLAVYWDHLREATDVTIFSMPYLRVGDGADVSSFGVAFGDTLTVRFINPFSGVEVNHDLTILATYGNNVFVAWETLVEYLNAQAAAYNDDTVFTIDSASQVGVQIKCFYRNRIMEPVEDLVSAPTLGFNTIAAEYSEGIDYEIKDNSVHILDYFLGTLSTEADSPVVNFNGGYVRHQELSEAGFDLVALLTAGVHAIHIESGADAGCYRIQSIDDETGAITLDRNLAHTSDSCVFRAPTFSAYNRVQGKLWSELSYFDNWQTVENNFGLFVGLPKDLVDSYDGSLDYLSVVRSMWFAFMSGPAFNNIQLGVQALFGLPYSEVQGQVTYHEEATPERDGTIVLIDKGSRVYTYTYPYGAELALNPRTGRQIQAFEPVDLTETTLNDEQRTMLEDSVIDAYTMLVDVVRVNDYISNPELVENVMSRNNYEYVGDDGEDVVVDLPPSLIQKYHTFVVDVPLEITQSTAVFPLIKDFLSEAKPAYTNFILQGSLLLVDEISLVDEPIFYPTMVLTDTPHTSPFFATKDELDDFGKPVVSPDKELYIWPVSKTYEKHDIDFSPILEASHFCLSGPYFDIDEVSAGLSYLYIDSDTIGTNLGYVTPDGETVYHPIIEEIRKAKSPPVGGIAIAVPGTPDFEIFAIGGSMATTIIDPITGGHIITKIKYDLREPDDLAVFKPPTGALAPFHSMNCLFFTSDNFPPPMPAIEYWDDEDVKEKYESGYCEGVLDDYSGDGSWNMRRGQLDMVNTVNSDIDVVRCRQWVRILHDFGNFPAQRFFEVGETISLVDDDGNPVTGTIWDDAPPVVLHVGYGENPKLPHVEHPAMTLGSDKHSSYLILGFEVTRGQINSVEESDLYDYEAAGISNYGHEERLDVIKVAQDMVGSIYKLNLRGNTSGATAGAFEPVDRDFRTLKETIWQTDKLIENGPASDPNIVLTTYIPVGGMVIDEFRSTTPTFDPKFNDQSAKYQWETQQVPFPHYPLADPSSKMIPSFNPGFYTNWAGTDTAVDKVVWGYDHDGGSLLSMAVDIDAFERPTNHAVSYLQNVHMGMKFKARKDHHVTHGFTNFRIPAPSIRMILPAAAGYDLRICGFYFCDDDPSRTALPTSLPESFGDPAGGEGVIGGSWLFFRDSETQEEFNNVDWAFEKGIHPGLPILPKGPLNDGTPTFIYGSADQRSDGHIIECHIPDLPEDKYYDIIIRNYRPYLEPGENWGDASEWRYHMEETVAHRAYYHSPGGHGGITWGIDPFGTGGI